MAEFSTIKSSSQKYIMKCPTAENAAEKLSKQPIQRLKISWNCRST
jgi:hypothetical protein